MRLFIIMDSGNEPMITVFSDRIEILSRGSLAPEQTMEGFFAGESVPVNRKLSEIFYSCISVRRRDAVCR